MDELFPRRTRFSASFMPGATLCNHFGSDTQLARGLLRLLQPKQAEETLTELPLGLRAKYLGWTVLNGKL